MTASLLTQIKEQYPTFSKSHKKLADFILNNYEKAAFFTAAKLGEETGISVSTVVRFATQMGFEGYPEFQSALRENIKGKLTSTQRLEVADNQNIGADILDTVLNRDIDMIKETLRSISRTDFDGAAKAINSASRIYILGVRSSAPLADFMYFYFKMVYNNVKLINSNSSSEMFEEIFRIGPDDVCIAASFPRYSKQVYNILNYIHDKGAKIIALTDNESSPIASLSDYVLVAKSSMASFIDSIVAPMSVVNALMVAATEGKHDDILDTFNELERVWDLYDVYEKLEDRPGDQPESRQE